MSEKNKYQHTLNLPKTEFSMRAGLAQKEPKMLEQWVKDGVYDKIRKNILSTCASTNSKRAQ